MWPLSGGAAGGVITGDGPGTSGGGSLTVNDLLPIVMDPNVHISEYKSATCDIRPGRRPRGPDLPRFVAEHRPPTTEGTDR